MYSKLKKMDIIRETLEEAKLEFCNKSSNWQGSSREDLKLGWDAGVKYQAERSYSEKDMKQFAWECVAKFLSNDDNKVEIKLVEVISDRINNNFEKFKNK